MKDTQKKFVPSSLPLKAIYPTRLCLQKWFKMIAFSMFSSVLKETQENPSEGLRLVWHRQERQGGDGICISPGEKRQGRWGQKPRGPPGSVPGSLTCSHSTAHSGRAHIRRSSRGDCWGRAHTLLRACRGSGDTRPHTFFQSTLWGQGQHKLCFKASPASHASPSRRFLPLSKTEEQPPLQVTGDRLGKHGRQPAQARGGWNAGVYVLTVLDTWTMGALDG